MTVAQILDKFLPITEPWIYSQIKGLERLGINSEIFCHRIINTDSYRHDKVYSYKDIPSWKINYYRALGRITNGDGATIFWNKIIKRRKDLPAENPEGQGRFDLIHSHFGWAAQKGIDLAIKNNIPHVVTFYGADITRDPFDPRKIKYQKKLPIIFSESKLILCTSFFLKRKIIELGADKDKIKVWRPGIKVDIDFSKFNKEEGKYFKIISVGRFIEWKGQKYLIKALAQVIIDHPHIEASFVGEGPTLKNCQDLARAMGIDSKIKFLGKLSNAEVLKEIASSDLIVHPSFTDNNGSIDSLGVVLAEAALCGVPAIATKIGGMPEIVIDQDTGLLVEEKNSADIAKKIIYLIQNKGLLEKFGKNAKSHANKIFHIDNQIKELKQILINCKTNEK